MRMTEFKFTTLVVGAGGIISVAILAAGFYGGYVNKIGIGNDSSDPSNMTKPMDESKPMPAGDIDGAKN